jgi:hypothetical protein
LFGQVGCAATRQDVVCSSTAGGCRAGRADGRGSYRSHTAGRSGGWAVKAINASSERTRQISAPNFRSTAAILAAAFSDQVAKNLGRMRTMDAM